MNTCGFLCFPASNPGDGSASYDCAHDEKWHYDIDGENVGCEECEEIADAPIGYHPDYEWRGESGGKINPDDPLTPRERREIESQLVGTLFPLTADEEQRRSFAYGNANISNPDVTREIVDEQADEKARES